MTTITHGTHDIPHDVPKERAPAPATEIEETPRPSGWMAALRIATGFVFLWAFLDKLFGLGYMTPGDSGWIDGGSPTKGFLSGVAVGPLESTFHDWAGAAWADWLFMLGLLGIGLALILGIGVRIAAVTGGLLLVLMWSAVLPPENNIFMDDHLIYATILVVLALVGAGSTLGLGRYWAKLPIVRANGWLK